MHLTILLAAVQIGLVVALPAPDLNTEDMNPANETVKDMSRFMPCDKKTLKVCFISFISSISSISSTSSISSISSTFYFFFYWIVPRKMLWLTDSP